LGLRVFVVAASITVEIDNYMYNVYISLRGIIKLPATLSQAEIDQALEAATIRSPQETVEEWAVRADGNADFVPTHPHADQSVEPSVS
jgi:hypothetical protein